MSSNTQNINYTDFKNICRTCLINCELKSIRQDNIIIEILHNLTGVRFETNDEFPQQICLNCFEKINEIHAFSSQCKQTHFTLIKCLNNFKNKRLEQEMVTTVNAKQKTNDVVVINDESSTEEHNIEFVPVNNYCEQSNSTNLKIKEEIIDDANNEINEDMLTETNETNSEKLEMIEETINELNDEMDLEADEYNNELNINCFQDNLSLPITDIDSNDSEIEAPPEMTKAEKFNLLPLKTQSQYERQYKLFMDWRLKNRTSSFSENVLLTYFENLSRNMKPSSLWAIYSMLRLTMNVKNNVDISKYHKLCSFLKCTSSGYKPKKTLILTPEQIQQFLVTAPDEVYLFIKVGLIFGMLGGCRREELMKIEITHVDDLQTALLVHIPDERTNTEHQFVIGGSMYNICKKYMELRPSNVGDVTRFFLNYQRGKCTKQPVGINKFGKLASQAATFLKLPDAKSYTGHCLRRSAAPTTRNRLRLKLETK